MSIMYVILLVTFAVVVATISYGLSQKASGDIEGKKKIRKALTINVATFVPVIAAAMIMVIPNAVMAATGDAASSSEGLRYIGMALSTGLACLGSGYAVGAIGSSALGAISEDPKMLGKTLIYIGLGEGIAIYGIIISILIMSMK